MTSIREDLTAIEVEHIYQLLDLCDERRISLAFNRVRFISDRENSPGFELEVCRRYYRSLQLALAPYLMEPSVSWRD